jgi:hypothetical protein
MSSLQPAVSDQTWQAPEIHSQELEARLPEMTMV